jgi:hypothetical protein
MAEKTGRRFSTAVLEEILDDVAPRDEVRRQKLTLQVAGVCGTAKNRVGNAASFDELRWMLRERFSRPTYAWLSLHPLFDEFIEMRTGEMCKGK